MKMGDVFCMAGFTAWQPTCSASFKPPKGRVAVVLLLGDADKKNPDSFDPALALNHIGWHREDGELIEGLNRKVEDLRKAAESGRDALEVLRRGHGVDVGAACYPALNLLRDALDGEVIP